MLAPTFPFLKRSHAECHLKGSFLMPKNALVRAGMLLAALGVTLTACGGGMEVGCLGGGDLYAHGEIVTGAGRWPAGA